MDKRREILEVCETRDLEQLRQFAFSEGGLADDEVRRSAWPILLGHDRKTKHGDADAKELPRHRDEEQVHLDVDRSFVYYPTAENEREKDARKAELQQVIIRVLRRHPMIHYFQGYHDIVQVFLLVLGVEEAIPAVERLSLLRIRDFMLPTMTGTEPHLWLLPTILHAADPALANHLSQTQPFFALPATLTLYAHQIEEYGSIARLFDFLLASEAVVPVYLFAATVLSRKEKLMEIEADEPEMLHSILSKLPTPLDLESLIAQAKDLFQHHPPDRLPGKVWSRVSKNSVLKTTLSFDQTRQQTLEDGERYFQLEAEEIRIQEARLALKRRLVALGWRYRRPAAYTGIAVFVAFIAMFARNSTLPISSTTIVGFQQRVLEIWQRFTS